MVNKNAHISLVCPVVSRSKLASAPSCAAHCKRREKENVELLLASSVWMLLFTRADVVSPASASTLDYSVARTESLYKFGPRNSYLVMIQSLQVSITILIESIW